MLRRVLFATRATTGGEWPTIHSGINHTSLSWRSARMMARMRRGKRHLRSLVAVPILTWAFVTAAATAPLATAGTDRFDWPLRPRPTVTRIFDKPHHRWDRGHRGVDLAGLPDQRVYAAGPGIVVFAGSIAGRPLVSVEHDGGLRTTYEPVSPTVKAGQRVDQRSVVGTLLSGHPGCAASACLHWGALRGPASRASYLDPLGLLKSTPLRLKPLVS